MNFCSRIRTVVACVLVLLAASAEISAQQVRQWVYYGSGGFVGNGYRSNVAAADSLHYASVGRSGSLALGVFLSDDGGISWNRTLTRMETNIDSLYQPLPGNWEKQTYSSIARPAPDRILLCGSVLRRADSQWYPVLLRSEDRGAHWSEISVGDSTVPMYAPILIMCDALTGVMTGMHQEPGSSTAAPALFFTGDGGVTWTAKPSPYPIVRQLLFPDSQALIAVSTASLSTSTDLGNSWGPDRDLPENTRVVTTVDGVELWAAAARDIGIGDLQTDIIYHSDDGGATWAQCYEGNIYPNFGINAMDFCDATNGIAVGQAGRILRTTDGGFSWAKEYEPYDLIDPSIGAVRFPSPRSAVAVTMNGLVTLTGKDVSAPPQLQVEQGATGFERRAVWGSIDGASGYILQLAEDEPSQFIKYDIFNTSSLKREWQTDDTAMSLDSALIEKKDYFVRVRALDGNGGSDWSKPVKFTTPEVASGSALSKAQLLQPAYGATDLAVDVPFAWKTVPDAAAYDLLIASNPLFADTAAYSVRDLTDTTATVTLAAGRTFFWLVEAHSPGRQSSRSGFREFSTAGTTSVDRLPLRSASLLQLYPQPARDFVHFIGEPETVRGACRLYDCLGRFVRDLTPYSSSSSSGTGSVASFDIRDLSSGVYFLVLPTARGIKHGRLLVQQQ